MTKKTMKKLINILVVFAMVVPLALTSCKGKTEFSIFSDKNGHKIPLWMENSVLLQSELAFGKRKTVGELFDSAKATTVVKSLTYTKDSFKIIAESYKGETVTMELTVDFKCAKLDNGGTCFIPSIKLYSPVTFKTMNYECTAPEGLDYGLCLGILQEIQPLMFD